MQPGVGGRRPDPGAEWITGEENVSRILARYGVEPAKEGAGPEIEDEDDEPQSLGSSGEGGTRRSGRRIAFDRAMLEQVAGPGVLGGPSYDRRALVEKYPAIRDGGQ